MEGTKKSTLIILGVILVIIVISVIVSINKKNNNTAQQTNTAKENFVVAADGTKTNTSEEVAKDKQVGDVLLEKSKIVFENGTSKLTSKVTNNGIAKDNLRFKVKFLANDGSIITESVGFVGKIKANEVKQIDSYITLDISNAKNIVYELMQ
jgi:hypothetical protein